MQIPHGALAALMAAKALAAKALAVKELAEKARGIQAVRRLALIAQALTNRLAGKAKSLIT